MCTVHTSKKAQKKSECLQETDTGAAAAVRVKQQNIGSAAVKNACLRSKSILWLAATHKQQAGLAPSAPSLSVWSCGRRLGGGSRWTSVREGKRVDGMLSGAPDTKQTPQNQTVTNDRGRFLSPCAGLQQEPSDWFHHPSPALESNPPPQDAPH